MYKVLITTTAIYSAISVHTVVAEFESKEDADEAVRRVKQNGGGSSYIQREAMPLYDPIEYRR